MKAFISHTKADIEFVRRLSTDLKRQGVDVWLDEWEIKVGDEIRQKIEHGIQEYDYFVIVLSHQSVASRWVEKELNAAYMREVSENQIVILPVRLDDAPIPVLLSGKRYADFRRAYNDGLKGLIDVLAPSEDTLPVKPQADVVVLESDTRLADRIAQLLERYDFIVATASDQAAALKLVREYQPRGILLNPWWMVSGEYRRDLIKCFRNASTASKIIGMTGMLDSVPDNLAAEFDVIVLKGQYTAEELEKLLIDQLSRSTA